MKFVSVCVVLLVCCTVKYEAAITDSQRSQIHTRLLTSGLGCIQDHPLTFEHIKSFRDRKVPDDEVAKCFAKCIFTSLGVMEDNGKISEKKAKKVARKIFSEDEELLAKVDELFSMCMKINDEETKDGEKGCDRAKLAFECFVIHAPETGFDVDI